MVCTGACTLVKPQFLMSRILYVHQYFKTPDESGAVRSYLIAKGLAKAGYDVHMLAGHCGKSYKKLEMEGFTIHYLPVCYISHFGFSKRYWAFLRFVFLSLTHFSKLPKPDLVYATSTPLTVGVIALWLKWTRGINFIFEVRDLWPDAPIALGVLRNWVVKKLALKLEKSLYANASELVALSPGIEKGIASKIAGVPTAIIPNMGDTDFFQFKAGGLNQERPFTIGYFGAMGLANHVAHIVQLAIACQRSKTKVNFLLVGDGPLKSDIEQMIVDYGLKNVELMPYQNRFEVRNLMKRVDACLTTFCPLPILQTNSPNKFFDGLASGRLTIVNTEGWLRELVETHQCGIYTDPQKPGMFPGDIQPFIEHPELLAQYQQNARALASRQFSKNLLVEQVLDVVRKHLPETNS
jgi:glycosyltransferase involved in cell wall biosynthesis